MNSNTNPSPKKPLVTYLDVVMCLEKEGKQVAAKRFQRSFFTVVETPQFMKDYGLSGERFTIPYGVISRHFDKDACHELSLTEWLILPEAIKHPFAVTKYYNDVHHKNLKGFRIYTIIPKGVGYIVVGVDVKRVNQGKNKPMLVINAITTVFGKEGKITECEVEIYRDEKTNPRQASLLERPNSSQYPFTEDSNCKNTKES